MTILESHTCPDGIRAYRTGGRGVGEPYVIASWPRALFTVRRGYFDQIEAGTKTQELRRALPRWEKIAAKGRTVGVFLCGRRVVRRQIVSVRRYPSARLALGREPSAQGARDLGPGEVLAFVLGRAIAPADVPPRPRPA